ncbi:MAG: membrane protein FxsA [Deltaproteobacteria bacterium]|nr:MAG: membrane protein FxsA [Deltaproteobacteria bacterium]
MFTRLLIIFLIVPALEIYTLLEAGRLIGVWPTIAMILATGIAGAWLARSQGIGLLLQIQKELAEGRMPADKLFDGVLILAGGLVLLTPGFWTDLLGFVCLVPVTRRALKRLLRRWAEMQIASGNIRIYRP